eukprot:gene15585-18515_t
MGSLERLIQIMSTPSLPLIKAIMATLTESLIHINHNLYRQIIHRDLKMANILVGVVNGKVQVNISDFGISVGRVASEIESTLTMRLSWRVAPPEAFRKRPRYGQHFDTFSLGCILYELLTRFRPFQFFTFKEYVQLIVKGCRPLLPSYIPEPYHVLLGNLWKQDPEERISLFDALKAILDLPPIYVRHNYVDMVDSMYDLYKNNYLQFTKQCQEKTVTNAMAEDRLALLLSDVASLSISVREQAATRVKVTTKSTAA